MIQKYFFAFAIALVAIAVPAFSQILDVAGDITEINPPASVREDVLDSNTVIQIFEEQHELLLGPGGIVVNFTDPGFYNTAPTQAQSIAQEASINSYLLHADSVDDERVRYTAYIRFNEDILGVIVTENELEASDLIIDGSVLYPQTTSNAIDDGRGLEFANALDDPFQYDWFSISEDRRTLLVSLVVMTKMDQMRVITDASADGGGELDAGCGGLGDAVIDISPGNRDNWIRIDSTGSVAVAIFSRLDFDAPRCIYGTTTPLTLTFGHTGDEESLRTCGVADSNEDGFDDLICDFEIAKTKFKLTDTLGTLKGTTVTGQTFVLKDSVTIIDAERNNQICCGAQALITNGFRQIVFTSQAINAAFTSVAVYDAKGKLVFQSNQSFGNRVLWRMSQSQARTLANGVYFYVLTVKTTGGKIIRSAVKPFAVLR